MPKKPKSPKLMKFDKRIRLGEKSFVDGKEVEFQQVLEEIFKHSSAKRMVEGITPSVSDAEELLTGFEQSGKSILAEYGYPEDWQECIGIDHETMPEIAYYAYSMLSHLWQTRHWMQQHDNAASALIALTKNTSQAARCAELIKTMSLTKDAAVREAINSICQFVYIKNSEIGDNYLRGEKVISGAKAGGHVRASEKNPAVSQKHREVLDYARNYTDNARDLASKAAKKFKLHPKTIREILRKSGFRKKS